MSKALSRARWFRPCSARPDAMARVVRPDEMFTRGDTALRLITLSDCTQRYVEWLADPDVNRYLETRFSESTLADVVAFAKDKIDSADSYLFAIVDQTDGLHIGNIKIGPINVHHQYADISYFIGERDRWGRGHATQAIRIIIDIGFNRLGLHLLQAGVYANNVASQRALLRAGFMPDGRMRQQLWADDQWQDHLWFGLLADEARGLNG